MVRAFAGYNFEGPYKDLSFIKDDRGLYVIQSNGQSKAIDAGIAGIGQNKDSQGLHRHLKNHPRKGCWERMRKGEQIIYFVMYTPKISVEELVSIETQIRGQLKPLCGADL